MDKDFVQTFDHDPIVRVPTIEYVRHLEETVKMKDTKIRELINAGEIMVRSAKEGLYDRMLDRIYGMCDAYEIQKTLVEKRSEIIK